MKKILGCLLGLLWAIPSHAELPASYTQLEYIESTGTQYIDTGIKTNQDTEIQSKWSSDLNSSWVYGDGSSNPRMTLYASTEGNQRFGNVFVTINAFVSSGAIHTTTQNKTGLLFDGEMHQYTNVGTFTVANTLTIFHNIYSPAQPGLSGNMYFLQVYNGETLVRDFIPAKRNSDGEVGMYDTVSGTFFTNQGTGAFIAGPVKMFKYPSYTKGGTWTVETGRSFVETDDELIITTTANPGSNNGIINTMLTTCPAGHKYYARIIFKGVTSVQLSGSNASPIDQSVASDDFTLHGWLFTTSTTSNRLNIRSHSPLDGQTIIKKNSVGLFDLTEIFGAGNEPTTVAEAEALLVANLEQIKIATTKYVDDEFAPLNTALANAISVVDNVVTQTIAQAGQIATLQNTKQTRPDDDDECPAGKKCLLVTDENGVPHWYEIIEGRLPDGYTELEYIESTGTQYIDTGFVPSTNYKHTIIFAAVSNGTGYVTGTGAPRSGNVKVVNGNTLQIWGNSVNGSSSTSIASTSGTFTSKTKLVMELRHGTESVVSLNGNDISGGAADIISSNRLILFGNASSYSLGFKIYQDKIEQNNTLVHNFIPAKRNSDSAIGMYDMVSGTFFENAGTGSFVGGAPVFN